MAYPNQNFNLWAGDSKTIVVNVVGDNGLPLNLEGVVIEWVMVKEGNSYYSITKTIEDGISITGLGQFEIYLFKDDTYGFAAGVYKHEAEVQTADGKVATIFTGKVNIYESIT